MPTDPYPLALLLFDLPDPNHPDDASVWSWPRWQLITGFTLPPYDPNFNSTVPPSSAIPEREHLALISFVTKFRTVEDGKQNAFVMKNSSDDNQDGRKAWREWVSKNWKRWNLLGLVEKTLKERGADPWTIMAEDNKRILPTQEEANTISHLSFIVSDILGLDALVNPANPNRIKPRPRRFATELITHLWNAYRKTIQREFNRIETERTNLEREWKRLQEDTTPAGIRSYLHKIDKLVALLSKYQDTVSLAILEEKRLQLQGMMSALGLDEKGKDASKKLPKPIRDALAHLASTTDIQILALEIHERLLNVQRDPSDVPDLNFDQEPPMEWEEGVEEFATKSMDGLWAILGLQKTKALPDFNSKIDVNTHNYWTDMEYMTANASNLRPLAPRWHQLVGIVKIVLQAFKGEPLMLMDQVGVGKTMQLVGAIVILAFFRDFYVENKKFPGGFEDLKWQGKEGNIPSQPILLTVPKSLELQFTNELRRYLRPKSFDILPYTGTWEKRQSWWTGVWSASNHDLSRRIVVAATTAVESDGSRSWNYSSDDPCKATPTAWLGAGNNRATTVYGYDWLVFGCDEFHFARSINKRYKAILPLVRQSSLTVTMTATPITTSIMDIWNLGRVLGIFTSTDNTDFNDMKRDINRARVQDRKSRDEEGNSQAGIIVRGILEGQTAPDIELQQQVVTSKWMKLIREKFRGKVMRRTGNSKDYEGKFISGIAAPSEHLLLLDLYEWERENLEKLADKMLESPQAGARLGSSENFYLDTRRALLHPSCGSPTHIWTEPTTIDEWKAKASVKLDALVQILTHHLKEDDAIPLQVTSDGHTLELSKDYMRNPPQEGLAPDKIVIYSEFPSSNTQIKGVLTLHGIDLMEYNGGMTQQQRGKVLEAFRANGGKRVLLLSNVGATGLNLDVASILIIIDTLWSAQDDSQLCGRVVRYPQPKHVHIYRLIAKNTSDVFLNNNSFGKEAIQQAFLGATPKMQSLFQHNPEVEDGNDGEVTDVSEDKGKKGKTKAPRKSRKSSTPHNAPSTKPTPTTQLPSTNTEASNINSTTNLEPTPVVNSVGASQTPTSSAPTFTLPQPMPDASSVGASQTPTSSAPTSTLPQPMPDASSVGASQTPTSALTPATPQPMPDANSGRGSQAPVTEASKTSSQSTIPLPMSGSKSFGTPSSTAAKTSPVSTAEVSKLSNPSTVPQGMSDTKSVGASQMPTSSPPSIPMAGEVSSPTDDVGMDLDDDAYSDDPFRSMKLDFTPSRTRGSDDMDMDDLFGDDPPSPASSTVPNPALGAKHLRSQNSTPLSSPSRNRTKRRKDASFVGDSSEEEAEQLTLGMKSLPTPKPSQPLFSPPGGRSGNASAGPSKHPHQNPERLIGPRAGKLLVAKSSRATLAPSQPHRSYPESKAGSGSADFDPSNTALGKIFAKGDATAEHLPVRKNMKDRSKSKIRN